jgi:hypothetical protein
MSDARLVPRQIPVNDITDASGSLICEDAVPCGNFDAFPELFYCLRIQMGVKPHRTPTLDTRNAGAILHPSDLFTRDMSASLARYRPHISGIEHGFRSLAGVATPG